MNTLTSLMAGSASCCNAICASLVLCNSIGAVLRNIGLICMNTVNSIVLAADVLMTK